jgi:hypothetical protein
MAQELYVGSKFGKGQIYIFPSDRKLRDGSCGKIHAASILSILDVYIGTNIQTDSPLDVYNGGKPAQETMLTPLNPLSPEIFGNVLKGLRTQGLEVRVCT